MKNKRNLKTWLGKCGNIAALCVIAVFMCYGIVSGGAEPPETAASEENASIEDSTAVTESVGSTEAVEPAEAGMAAETAEPNAAEKRIEPDETSAEDPDERPDGVLDGFINPVAEGYISSSFGERNGRRHTGLDIAASQGSEIMAAADGLATFAGANGGYGNYLVINHGGGVETCYAHCSEILVREGDSVRQGEVVALVGSTGNSTGPHLHFEIKENGEFLDPAESVSYS